MGLPPDFIDIPSEQAGLFLDLDVQDLFLVIAKTSGIGLNRRFYRAGVAALHPARKFNQICVYEYSTVMRGPFRRTAHAAIQALQDHVRWELAVGRRALDGCKPAIAHTSDVTVENFDPTSSDPLSPRFVPYPTAIGVFVLPVDRLEINVPGLITCLDPTI